MRILPKPKTKGWRTGVPWSEQVERLKAERIAEDAWRRKEQELADELAATKVSAIQWAWVRIRAAKAGEYIPIYERIAA